MIRTDGNWRVRYQLIRNDEVSDARMMDIQHEQHRRRLWAIVDKFKAKTDVHILRLVAMMATIVSMRRDSLEAKLAAPAIVT